MEKSLSIPISRRSFMKIGPPYNEFDQKSNKEGIFGQIHYAKSGNLM